MWKNYSTNLFKHYQLRVIEHYIQYDIYKFGDDMWDVKKSSVGRVNNYRNYASLKEAKAHVNKLILEDINKLVKALGSSLK